MESKSLSQSLAAAKTAKQDEFYKQYVDIQKEVEAYLEFDPVRFGVEQEPARGLRVKYLNKNGQSPSWNGHYLLSNWNF